MKKLKVTVNGKEYDVVVEEISDASTEESTHKESLNKPLQQNKKTSSANGEPIKAPMPGTILSVNVNLGQKVKKGEVLAILEAMKMENEIVSPKDAEVSGINIKKGDSVELGTNLFFIN